HALVELYRFVLLPQRSRAPAPPSLSTVSPDNQEPSHENVAARSEEKDDHTDNLRRLRERLRRLRDTDSFCLASRMTLGMLSRGSLARKGRTTQHIANARKHSL